MASTSFGPIEARNALAGNQFSGLTTINLTELKDSLQPLPAYRAIQFPHNDDFIPRPAIRQQIDTLLPPKIGYQSAALWGLGGSGKTQIALDYAYSRCSDPECSVFWVHADSETSFAQDYKNIARKLGLSNNFEGEELLLAVRSQIETLPHWVMILDNADNLTLFGVGRAPHLRVDSAPDLSAYVPCGPVGTILWTSRDQRIAGSLVGPRRSINVLRMTDSEAETLLKTMAVLMTEEVETDTVARLIAELDWLPLAITQAAAYIRRTKLSIIEYLQKIQDRKKPWKVSQRSEHDRHRRPQISNSILETLNISIEYIQQENQTAYDILTVLGYVNSQNIPFDMIIRIVQEAAGRHLDSRDSEDSSNNEDQEAVIEAVARLEEFSFLTLRAFEKGDRRRANRAYDMHKLVQKTISYRLHMQRNDISREAHSARVAFQVINSLFPSKWQRDTWDQCEQYLGHVQPVGKWAHAHNGEENVSQLFQRVSNYLYDRGRWRERELVNILLLRLRKKALGDRHPNTIDSMASLATTYHAQGRYDEDEKLSVEVLQLQRDILGDKHPKTIDSMASLAATYHSQGRYDENERLSVEVLQLRRNILGDKHPNTIDSMASLAATYHSQRKYDEDERLSVEVLQLRRDILGDKHPSTIDSMVSLAATYHSQGRYDEAEKIVAEVLKLRRGVLGENHARHDR